MLVVMSEAPVAEKQDDAEIALWEMSAGDRDLFAVDFRFLPYDGTVEWNPLDMPTSWGEFSVWVNNVNLCAHRMDGAEWPAVRWYLLPMLRWFAENWSVLILEDDPLILDPRQRKALGLGENNQVIYETWKKHPLSFYHEEDFPIAAACSAWHHRHALRMAREGGIFPDVTIRNIGGRVHIRWNDWENEFDDARFTAGSGSAELLPVAVALPLHEVLVGATEWLSGQLPESDEIRTLAEETRLLRA